MWSARLTLLFLLLLALGAAPAAAAAQGPDTPVSADEVTGPPAALQQVPPTPAGAQPGQPGLPERAAPARTLRAYWHVFIAFAIVWLLVFGYALSLGRRLAALEREIRTLGRGAPPV